MAEDWTDALNRRNADDMGMPPPMNADKEAVECRAAWQAAIDGVSAQHQGTECAGPNCRICKALIELTYAFDERDRAIIDSLKQGGVDG